MIPLPDDIGFGTAAAHAHLKSRRALGNVLLIP